MALMYYGKISFNSHIYETKQYKGKIDLNDVLDRLYESINDSEEYIIENFYDSNDQSKKTKEIYNFSELRKVKNEKEYYIVGNIVRRFPYFTERFDEEKRISVKDVIEDNSSSILFYMDVKNEIVTFCNRKNFKQRQFANAFKNLINQCCKEYGFEFILINDPFTMKERLKKVKTIYKIISTVIPPNVNEERLKELYDGEVKDLHEGNIGKKTSIFEKDRKNEDGIKAESPVVKKVIDSNEAFKKFQRGYAKLQVEGEYPDGSKFKFDSDEDSPYMTTIDDELKDTEADFIEVSKSGILIYIEKIKLKMKTNKKF